MLRHLLKLALLTLTAFIAYPLLKQINWNYISSQAKYVVMITNLEENSGGTGFYLRSNGKTYIITNEHVCGLANEGLVVIHSDDYKYATIVHSIYPYSDLCAIKAPAEFTTGLRLARGVSRHERIYVVGHPILEPTSVTEGEISSAVTITVPYKTNVDPKDCKGYGWRLVESKDFFSLISGIMNYCVRDLDTMSMTAQILGGNSGSPVLNMYGNVVGVVFAGYSNRSYAVTYEDLRDFVGMLDADSKN